MGYRKNPTDQQQSVLEATAFNAGIPVFEDAKTRVVANGAKGATEKTAHRSSEGGMARNAGVVMPIADVPNSFANELQGKA